MSNLDPNWELRNCCNHDQVVFLATIGVFTVVILALWRTIILTPFKLITVFLHEASHAIACKLTCGQVEGMEVHANEGGVTRTRGGVYWLILPAGYLGSSFWGMALILASTNLLTARIAAGCFVAALLIVLFIAKNWTLRGLCIGFIVFLAIIWVLQELTPVRILRYVILFIGVMNSLFSFYDIYDDLISRRVHSSDDEKFAELCPCPCTGVGWGVIWLDFMLLFLPSILCYARRFEIFCTVYLMMSKMQVLFFFHVIAHAPWNGVRLADLVIPFFLFAAGLSLALVYKKVPNRAEATRKAVLRAVKLFLLGILLQDLRA